MWQSKKPVSKQMCIKLTYFREEDLVYSGDCRNVCRAIHLCPRHGREVPTSNPVATVHFCVPPAEMTRAGALHGLQIHGPLTGQQFDSALAATFCCVAVRQPFRPFPAWVTLTCQFVTDLDFAGFVCSNFRIISQDWFLRLRENLIDLQPLWFRGDNSRFLLMGDTCSSAEQLGGL